MRVVVDQASQQLMKPTGRVILSDQERNTDVHCGLLPLEVK
jgi:hypothetical protein